jgi:hypothetical protein
MIDNSSDPSGNEQSNFFPEKSQASAYCIFTNLYLNTLRHALCALLFPTRSRPQRGTDVFLAHEHEHELSATTKAIVFPVWLMVES